MTQRELSSLTQSEESSDLSRRTLLTAALSVPLVAGAAIAGAESADAAARIVGTMSIPRIGIRRAIYSDALTSTLTRRGVGLYRGSAMPGTVGRTLIFGHRTSYGGPLRRTNELRKGDPVILAGRTYKVHSVVVVTAADLRKALRWQGAPRSATLISCTKRDGTPTSTAYRLLVRLVG